ncbi:hypothetical protein ACFL2O_04900 [Thermodesulfobacteriota bacterium]
MGQVKGSIFIPWVIGIRADKSGACDKHLTDEDRKVISNKILASSWYPIENYMNIVNTVVKEIAKGDMRLVRQWGRDFTDSTYKHIYKNLFSESDSRRAMRSHQLMFKTLYDSVTVDLEEISENEYIVTFKGIDPNFKPFFYVTLGTFEKSLEYGGAQGLEAEFIDKSWNGASETRIRFSWESWGR